MLTALLSSFTIILARSRRTKKEGRGYEKPWLIGINNPQNPPTRTFAKTHSMGWKRPSKNAEERREDEEQKDFIDFGKLRQRDQTADITEIAKKELNYSRTSVKSKSKTTAQKQRKLNHYEIGEVLGKGSYAMVHKVKDTRDNHFYALKTYDKSKMNSKTRRTIVEREIQVLGYVESPLVVKLFKTIYTKNHVSKFGDSQDSPCNGAC